MYSKKGKIWLKLTGKYLCYFRSVDSKIWHQHSMCYTNTSVWWNKLKLISLTLHRKVVSCSVLNSLWPSHILSSKWRKNCCQRSHNRNWHIFPPLKIKEGWKCCHQPGRRSWLVTASERLTLTLSATACQETAIKWAEARTGKAQLLTWSEKLTEAQECVRGTITDSYFESTMSSFIIVNMLLLLQCFEIKVERSYFSRLEQQAAEKQRVMWGKMGTPTHANHSRWLHS